MAAERFGLQPGVLCPNGTLEGIARREPKTVTELLEVEGLRRWQAKELGAGRPYNSRLLSIFPIATDRTCTAVVAAVMAASTTHQR